jgi:TolB protein
VDDFPAWIPGERKISFVRVVRGKAGIYVMNADGTDQHAVLHDPKVFLGGYAWSPDGRKLAFGSARDQAAGELYVANADGSGLHRLTKNRFGDSGPVW